MEGREKGQGRVDSRENGIAVKIIFLPTTFHVGQGHPRSNLAVATRTSEPRTMGYPESIIH